ncbi:MAG: SDR family NAD(P)-dependent oxidoreductase [Planctomycetota bacterium]|jgi:NAD(P)-dependent dehydrogenase (short-subunit alcohol dehydrogenase family)
MADFALVTGGSSGIGAAIVAALEADGYDVLAVSRSSGWDLTEPNACDRLIASLDRLDLLVNNAGIAESAPASRTTDEDWARHFALNVDVPFRLCRAAYPLLGKSANPRIVNVGSVAGLAGSPYIAAYAASKHALMGLTRVLVAEWPKFKVHAVCPGFVDTPLTDRSVANITAQTDLSADQARAALAKQNPSGRLITPEEVAAVVVELARLETTGEERVLD